MSLVLDASMAVSWLFKNERTDAAHEVMLRAVTEGAMVPSLWRLEIANVLRNAVRRGRCDKAYVDRSLERLGRLPITIDDETDQHAWGATRILSFEHGLTLYDAAYLELAIRSGRALASCDSELLAAATECKVATITA